MISTTEQSMTGTQKSASRSRGFQAIAIAIAAAATFTVAPNRAAAQATAGEGTLDLLTAQALLDVQALDGWLLSQTNKNSKQNPIASELVGAGSTNRAWFYWVPADGKPVAVFHRSDAAAFDKVNGEKTPYAGNAQLKKKLKEVLGDAKAIAMEYAPSSGIKSLTRVSARTAKMVKSLGVAISSSAPLVQVTKAAWGSQGRVAHYVAAHHLRKLVDEATAMIGEKLSSETLVTEYDVQQFIARGYQVRGLKGAPPIVAAGANTADPTYVPTARSAKVIKPGDLIQFELSGKLASSARPIVANLSWVAFAGTEVPEGVRQVFGTVTRAQGKVLDLLRIRMAEGRPVAGFEADRAARDVVDKDGHAENFPHSTGHSLDTSVEGDGANLDSKKTRDTRNLVVGSGFTVGPGVYNAAEKFGLRCEVSVFLGASGVEVTTEPQKKITTIALEKAPATDKPSALE